MIVGAAFLSDLLRSLLQGTPPGTVYALLGLGLVLTYKTSGIFNLALGAQAYISAAMFFQAKSNWHWPTLPALIVAVGILAPGVGLILERLVFRHLRNASSVAKLVVTIGLAVAVPAIFDLIVGFQPVAGQTPQGIVPGGATVFYNPIGVYALSRNELTAVVVTVLAMGGLAALFRFSAIGLQMRAVVESPRMTELNGVRADRVSAFSWALSSFFAGLAGVLIAPTFNSLESDQFFNLMVIAIAAAAVGLLVSLPRTLLGGIGLGWLLAFFATFLPKWSDSIPFLGTIQESFAPAVPFIVLFGVLVASPTIRRSRAATDPLSGVDPPAPAPAALTRAPIPTTLTRGFWVVFFVIAGCVVFFRADASWMYLVSQAIVLTVIFLSITVITGFAGEISLCQGTFAAIGAFTVYQLASSMGVSVLVAMPIGGVIAAGVGALLALPVLRLAGVWLSIATLAFAYFFDSVMVKFSWVGGGSKALSEGTRVPRPTLGVVNLTDDRAFLALCIVVLGLVAAAVVAIRSGTVGQTLRALRGSKLGAQSIGISPARARITAFMISAFLAGLGGGLLAIQQQDVNYESNFSPFASLFWLVLVVSLGARTVEGAMQAGAAYGLFDAVLLSGTFIGWIARSADRVPSFFPLSNAWVLVIFGLGALQFARHPEGLVENGKRKAFAFIERRGLFAQASHATVEPDEQLATQGGQQ